MRIGWLLVVCVGCAASRTVSVRGSEPGDRFDLDGDGAADLLVRESWTGNVVPVSVDGTIRAPILTTDPNDGLVRLGDMDGDGRRELGVVVADDVLETRLLEVHRGTTDGVEREPWAVVEVAGSEVWHAGDVDGDGLDDLVVAGFGSNGQIVHGDPAAPWLQPLDFHPSQLDTPELDGDGLADAVGQDLVDGIRRVHIRFGPSEVSNRVMVPELGTGFVWGPVVHPGDPGRDVLASIRLLSERVIVEGYWEWTGSSLARIDGGAPEAMPYDRGQILGDRTLDSIFVVFPPLPDGGCLLRFGGVDTSLAELVLPPFAGFGCANTRVHAVGDLDGDGFDDLTETVDRGDGARGVRLHHGGHDALRPGVAVLPPAVEGLTTAHGDFFPAGDLDGDGRDDLIATGEPCAMLVRGRPDLVLVVEPACGVAVRRGPFWNFGDQDGRPGDETFAPGLGVLSLGASGLELLAPTPGFALQPIGDVNGDGFVDLASPSGVVLGGDNIVRGDFTQTALSAGFFVDFEAPGDVDGDGIDDLWVDAGILRGGPDFATRAELLDVPLDGTSAWEWVALGDRDGDGADDLGARHMDALGVIALRGDTWIEIERLPRNATRLGDVDGDGRADVHAYPDVLLTTGARWELGVSGWMPAGDLDGDSRVDVLHGDRPSVVFWHGAGAVESVVQRPLEPRDLRLEPIR